MMNKNNSDQTKKIMIKSAARQLFFHFGLGKTSMDDIAQQCNLAKPSLYYYYPSKEAIFNEIVIDEAQRFIDRVEEKIPVELPADEKISFFLHTVYFDLKKYLKEIETMPEFLYESYPHGKPIILKINKSLKDKLRPLLMEGIAQKKFSIDNLETTLNSILTMVSFLNIDWMRKPADKARDEIVTTVINIILNGIRRRKCYEK